MSRLFKTMALLAVINLLWACSWLPPSPIRDFSLPKDFYPESIAVSPDGTFYIGSWREGAIARLAPGQHRAGLFVAPGSNGLSNTQGVLVDQKRGRLWACSGSLGYTTVPRTPSALKSFDLATGAALHSYALPGGGYCNDLALAPDGRLYVTDSKHARILVLDRSSGHLRTWVSDPAFCPGSNGFCLNGIAIDPGQAIYVSAVNATDRLFRVPFVRQGRAGRVGEVVFPRVLKNADGIRYLQGGRLLIFESNAFARNDPLDGSVSLASLHTDGTASLKTLVNGLASPSSGVAYNGRVYFIQSKYAILLRHPANDTAEVPRGVPFMVQSVPLPRP
ncbi:Vgb family protein [Mangrovitalea sediminis]|uniref:Vgb family protein n=1 Tax=Mangrovitalea sediminis TaxID=1982043 RepID=UPI000BE53E13|nr:hypothetical protein [Mangrovitalea sediminis]